MEPAKAASAWAVVGNSESVDMDDVSNIFFNGLLIADDGGVPQNVSAATSKQRRNQDMAAAFLRLPPPTAPAAPTAPTEAQIAYLQLQISDFTREEAIALLARTNNDDDAALNLWLDEHPNDE